MYNTILFYINFILKILSSYAILIVLAKDLGYNIGKKQDEIIKMLPSRILLLYSGAFMINENHIVAVIIVGLYFGLKYLNEKFKKN